MDYVFAIHSCHVIEINIRYITTKLGKLTLQQNWSHMVYWSTVHTNLQFSEPPYFIAAFILMPPPCT